MGCGTWGRVGWGPGGGLALSVARWAQSPTVGAGPRPAWVPGERGPGHSPSPTGWALSLPARVNEGPACVCVCVHGHTRECARGCVLAGGPVSSGLAPVIITATVEMQS